MEKRGSKLKKGNGFCGGIGQGDRDRAYAETGGGLYLAGWR